MCDQETLLSICVPTYNRLDMLRRNIDFHLHEFRKRSLSFEIVVVDDGSTDGTAEYIVSLSGVSEISPFQRTKNSGFLSNYAFAMRRARGRYAVFLGDDDLLIPDRVLHCLSVLDHDRNIGMIQAPWLLIDEARGGVEMGPFYHIPSETRFTRGDFASMTQFIFDFHVFPEFMIVRSDVVRSSVSGSCPFIFWAFLFTARSLARADIVYMPQPFARVTAISADSRFQQGNRETMFKWDDYRGGVEYLVSLFQNPDVPLERRTSTTDKINRFMMIRQKVALKLLIDAGYWAECCILYRRISAYEAPPLSFEQFKQVSQMAGIDVATREAIAFGFGPVIVDPAISDDIVALLKTEHRARLVRPPAGEDAGGEPRAYLRLNPAFPEKLRDHDAVFDLQDYLAQFGAA
ncbi:glycosyltransferase [Lichenibacterium ramalinae]|uniref:Glycosyltransferase family 2 protein n=1 Tax=Lichenibacterium ramalinae TaxID=2316527 RepID=A0A4Q2RGY9_9HYPH|nr:glycosyltransferase [Lichenibacterium ramalinae]RYB05952.1 glycosyltransferase family 2 protein [Lichenibacterium ramalinae]